MKWSTVEVLVDPPVSEMVHSGGVGEPILLVKWSTVEVLVDPPVSEMVHSGGVG